MSEYGGANGREVSYIIRWINGIIMRSGEAVVLVKYYGSDINLFFAVLVVAKCSRDWYREFVESRHSVMRQDQ